MKKLSWLCLISSAVLFGSRASAEDSQAVDVNEESVEQEDGGTIVFGETVEDEAASDDGASESGEEAVEEETNRTEDGISSDAGTHEEGSDETPSDVPVNETRATTGDEPRPEPERDSPSAERDDETQARQVRVETIPPGSNVELVPRRVYSGSVRGSWHSSPQTFRISSERHVLSIMRRHHTPVVMPIAGGDEDLLVEVDLSRPVFGAGIAFNIIGATTLVGGLIGGVAAGWMGVLGIASGPASLAILTGALMMALDRQRYPTYRITEVETGRHLRIQPTQRRHDDLHRTRLLFRASLGYIPHPSFHSLTPEIGIGMHWQLERVDIRLLFQAGPTATASPGSDVRGQGFVVTGFMSRFGRFYFNVEMGLGGGRLERTRQNIYNQDIRVEYSFTPVFYSGFDLGYSNNGFSFGPGVRLYLGPGRIEEYDWTSSASDRFSTSRVMPFALSIGLHVEYAWPL